MLRLLADAALSVLLAPCCATCGEVLTRPLAGAVCPACWARVARFSPPLCAVCGEPLPSARGAPEGRCRVCSVALGAATMARAVGAFDGALAEVVHALKYARRPSVAPPLARLMRSAGQEILADVDLVVPVPLHRRRERERGFNQAEALARGLGPPVVAALTRGRAHGATGGPVGGRAPRQPARAPSSSPPTPAACAAASSRWSTTSSPPAPPWPRAPTCWPLAEPRAIVALTAARAVTARPR